MKKIYIILAILVLVTTACNDDFINLKPEDQYSAASFYQTEPQFRQAIVATYVPLRSLINNDFYLSEVRSDNTDYDFNGTVSSASYVNRENIADFLDESTNSTTNAVYFACFEGISRANIIIERLPDTEVSAQAKADIDGQAKFLRAFNYFKLVRYFGGVPLYLKEVRTAEDAFMPRSTKEEVYARIISDAKDAINELAPPAKFPQSGQATKGAATMLLAEVYMTQNNYLEAETLLKTLPAMGYALNANYADAFLTTNKNSRESLFEVQYQEGVESGSQPSNFIYTFLPRSTNTFLITGVKTNNSSSGGWNKPTEDLISAYEPNDKRLDASIGIAEGVYDASARLTISDNKSIINYTPAPGKVGVPYIKKYVHPHANPNNTNENWPIYRYSDALLMLAEALNNQGGAKSAEALIYLNEVRDRAFGVGNATITTTDPSSLKVIIAHERRVELAFENHRWHDLVRTGKAIEVMNAYGTELKKKHSYLLPEAYNVTPNKLLYPIPASERELNPTLTQNPGYY